MKIVKVIEDLHTAGKLRDQIEPTYIYSEANEGVTELVPICFYFIKSNSTGVGDDNDRCLSAIDGYLRKYREYDVRQ